MIRRIVFAVFAIGVVANGALAVDVDLVGGRLAKFKDREGRAKDTGTGTGTGKAA